MALPPPPVSEDMNTYLWKDWFRKLRLYLTQIGQLAWTVLDFTGSNITDIITRQHRDLQDLQGGTSAEYYHLTSAQHTDLTDGGDTSLHKHAHNDQSGLQGGTASEYYHITANTKNNVIDYLNGGSTGSGWRDLLGVPSVRTPGANDPTWAVWKGGIRKYQFSNALMNEMWFSYHIDHDYKIGSDIHIHVHWSQATVDTGGTAGAPGQAKWYMEVTYAKGHQQQAFVTNITTSVTQTASGTQYQHMLGEVQLSASSPTASQLDTDDLEPDGVIEVRLYRDPADVADTLNQTPFLHFVDIHYQADRVNTKNKSPNFYT